MNSRIKVILSAALFFSMSLFFSSSSTAIDNSENKKPQQTQNPNDTQLGAIKEKPASYIPGQIIIKLKEGKSLDNIQVLMQKHNIREKRKIFKDTVSVPERIKKLKNNHNNLDNELKKAVFTQTKNRILKEKEAIQNQIKIQEKIKNRLEARQKRARLSAKPAPKLDNIYILKTADQNADLDSMISEIMKNPDVEYAHPNYQYQLDMVPNDPYWRSSNSWGQGYDDLWGLKKIQASPAWDISQGEGVVVAVIDTGIDYNHPDIAGNIWTNPGEIPNNGIDDDSNGFVDDTKGWNFVRTGGNPSTTADNDPMDKHGHGTHCAGTIAAIGNNSIGVIGVAPKAKVMAVKTFDKTSQASIEGLISAIKYAADNGADILSNSWGGSGFTSAMSDVFAYAQNKGCVLIASAGNDSSNVAYKFPANDPNVIAVGSSDHNDQKSDFSNFGLKIDVTAPGGDSVPPENKDEDPSNDTPIYYRNILSLRANGTDFYNNGVFIVNSLYFRLKGTSMAAPHVSGLAALILAKDPLLLNEEVRDIIRLSSDDVGTIGKDIYFGYGRINAFKAVSLTSAGYRAGLISPANHSFIKGVVNISGRALWGGNNFEKYELYYALKKTPLNRTLINSSVTPLGNGSLGMWDTTKSPDEQYVLTLKIISKDGKEIEKSIEVTVDNVNNTPQFINLTNQAPVIGNAFDLKVQAEDIDDPATASGQLRYSVSGLPSGATFNPTTQIFSWTPQDSAKGIYEVTFTVSDSGGLSFSQKINFFTVVVENTSLFNYNLTNDWPDRTQFDIYNDKIVWADSRNGNYDIYMYDITNSRETRITTNPADEFSPHIYQNKIIWEDGRNDAQCLNYRCDLYAYDLSSSQESRISTASAVRAFGDFYENKFVSAENWDLNNPSSYNIFMYDLSNGTKSQITNSGTSFHPVIYQNNIIYVNRLNLTPDAAVDNWDLYAYNLATKKETPLTTAPYKQHKPAIYKDKIVWADNRNSTIEGVIENSDIYIYDLQTQKENQITKNTTNQSLPDIYEDKIIWQDQRSLYSQGVNLYDLSTAAEAKIIENTHLEYKSRIFENKVIWREYRGGLYQTLFFFPPQMTYRSHSAAKTGDVVTINGKNFGYTKGDSKVQFANGVLGTINTWSNTTITFAVPPTAGSGLLKVITKGGISNGINIIIDNTPPNPVTAVNAPAFGLPTTLSFSWSPSTDPESGIAYYYYGIRKDSPTGPFVKNWTNAGQTTTANVTGLSLVPGSTYYVGVSLVNGAGASNTVKYSSGIVIDGTAPVPITNLYTPAFGLTTALQFSWSPSSDPESGIKYYYYGIRKDSPTGTLVKNWTSVGQATSANVTGLNLVPSTKYYVGVSLVNGAGASTTVKYSSGIVIDATAPVPITNVYTPAFALPRGLPFSWIPTSDPESGISYYKYIIRKDSTSGAIVQDWTSVGANITNVFSQLNFVSGSSYYVGVSAVNKAGASSLTKYSSGIIIDGTAPNPITNVTVPAFSTPTTLSISWSPSSDPESGIKSYYYGIRQDSPTGPFLRGWTMSGQFGQSTSETLTGLNLIPGKTYYVGVYALNKAGASGTPTYSSGVLIQN